MSISRRSFFLLSALSLATVSGLTPTLAAPKSKAPAKATPRPVSAPAAPTAPSVRTWALLIGISKYQNPQISSLRFPATDAAGIREALTDPQLGGVPDSQIKLLTDTAATAANIKGAVDSFLKPNVKAGDQVIVFLAGHGVSKGIGVEAKSYLLPTDVRGVSSAALESSAVDLRELSNTLGQLPASQFVVFVDACREDPTPGRGIKGNQLSDVMSRSAAIVPQNDRPASAVTFFACDVGQRAFEDARLQHGVFTYWILDGIRQGAVPQRDGTVRMGGLAGYVTSKVTQWAQATSKSGDFEVEQTPVMTASNLTGPIVLMRVKRAVSAEPFSPKPPKVTVATFPVGAQVTVNGRAAGAGDVTVPLSSSGDVQIRVEYPGYEPISRSVRVQDGFELQVPIQLQPGARGLATPTAGLTADVFKAANEAEARQQWETAMAGYNNIIQSDPKFQPAYERLAELKRLDGDLPGSIETLIAMVNNTTPSAHSYSLLARAYSRLWERTSARESSGKKDKKRKISDRAYSVPSTSEDAATLARRAADEAVRISPNSPEAQLALGFALVADDTSGRNKRDAMGAFGKAVFSDGKDAANHYGMGYGIRFFSTLLAEGTARDAELRRAVSSLKKAVELRPGYFDAHRELAYAYYQLKDNQAALQHAEIANACRADAADKDEVAGVNVAMAGIHEEQSQSAGGNEKQGHQQASTGYISDAKENSSDLSVALGFLNKAGVSTRLGSYLPRELQRAMNWRGTLNDKVNEKIPGDIKIPGGGGIRLPRF